MSKIKKSIVVLVVCALIGVGIYSWKNKKPSLEYTTTEAQKGTIFRTVSVTGTLVSEEQVNVASKTMGELTDLSVDMGDRVVAGQKVAVIERGTLNEQLRQCEANIKMQKEMLENMRDREAEYRRDQKDAQKNAVKKAQAEYDAVMRQIYDTVLTAPISGIVIKKNLRKGEIAGVNSPILTIASEGELEVEADVPESDIVEIVVGQKAQISLDALSSEEKLSTEVVEIEPSSTVIQDVVYYKVKLKLLDSDDRLKHGMSADIDIHTFEKPDVITIPERSIKSENGKKYVEIVKPDSSLEKRYVETGVKGDEGMIEIRSGLSGGEKIVTFVKAS